MNEIELSELCEKYCYLDDKEKWQIKDEAPADAREALEALLYGVKPDADGTIIQM